MAVTVLDGDPSMLFTSKHLMNSLITEWQLTSSASIDQQRIGIAQWLEHLAADQAFAVQIPICMLLSIRASAAK